MKLGEGIRGLQSAQGRSAWLVSWYLHVASTGIENFTLQILLELVASIQPQGVQVWTVKQYQKPRVTV
jgi:hypothetical protein